MNLEKTGRLIAACRTEKGLTQQQLAQKLFVTDKAVSKWERGKSFPGVDLLEPLGKELGLSVTELLSGERIPPEALSAASDRVSVDQLRESNRIRRRLRILAAVFSALLIGMALLHLPVIRQRGDPLPYLLPMARVTFGADYVPVAPRRSGDADTYLSRRGDCPSLIAHIEASTGLPFQEQMGSAYLFSDGSPSLTLRSEIYWRWFTVWEVIGN